jgi:transglutaminase-like putative cysteine protease
MFIRLGYELVFDVPAPVPMMMLLYTHPSRQNDLCTPDALQISPSVEVDDFTDAFGNRVARVMAQPGKLRLYNDLIVKDSGVPDPQAPHAMQHPVEELPPDTLQFLLGSRYCEVDKLSDIAWNLFGQTPPGWARVAAICDWVHNHVTFGYQYARSTKTAVDVYDERRGVCRDFQHLAITFCRCLNIPARYATGYLGDIGVPASPNPMDFSAWFEAYLGGQWWTWDARHNKPRLGRVLMATGRDAVDVALTTSFGSARLEKFAVTTQPVDSADLHSAQVVDVPILQSGEPDERAARGQTPPANSEVLIEQH